jgi:hypothetical protein
MPKKKKDKSSKNHGHQRQSYDIMKEPFFASAHEIGVWAAF